MDSFQSHHGLTACRCTFSGKNSNSLFLSDFVSLSHCGEMWAYCSSCCFSLLKFSGPVQLSYDAATTFQLKSGLWLDSKSLILLFSLSNVVLLVRFRSLLLLQDSKATKFLLLGRKAHIWLSYTEEFMTVWWHVLGFCQTREVRPNNSTYLSTGRYSRSFRTQHGQILQYSSTNITTKTTFLENTQEN